MRLLRLNRRPNAPIKRRLRKHIGTASLLAGWLLAAPLQASANPNTAVFKAFLSCDAQFFKALTEHGEQVTALRPLASGEAGLTHLAVPDRGSDDSQALALDTAFNVEGIDFNEFVDEITRFDSHEQTAYDWGFNTDAKLAQVLALVQALLPPARRLSADGDTWARIDVFEQGAWRNVPEHAELKGKPATLPERALIVQSHEGGGTRVVCGLHGAPLPAAELKLLRPGL
jgi:hypothetical protein